MSKKGFLYKLVGALFIFVAIGSFVLSGNVGAQDTGPALLDPALGVRTVVEGMTTPIGLAFLNETEMFVIEKNTGQVKHVVNGQVQGIPLDLAVNSASERGLLGITLDPDFANNGFVYLFWSCAAPPPTGTPFFPSEIECADEPLTGDDSDDILAVPLIGNRVDRFVWDGTNLTWERNLVKMRSFQNDGAPIPRGQDDEDQPPRGNHDGGVITFGQDGMLYIIIGDVGRRSAMQNLPAGPITYTTGMEGGRGEGDEGRAASGGESQGGLGVSLIPFESDDQFGGPQPDDAHHTGVILRLNPDGTIPTDNPFYDFGSAVTGEIGENLQMTFAYGIRNSFGMDVDPMTGNLWISENGEDAYDEINLVRPGFNSGWIQIMGPSDDVANYRQIETTSLQNEDFPNLQQFRWSPNNIATTRQEALSRLTRLPGSQFSDPEFSWEFAVAPAAVGFMDGAGLGDPYNGDLFAGLSVPLPVGGPLLRFDLQENRRRFVGPNEAENRTFNSLIGSEDLVVGTGFGIITDLETGPNGNLYVVSLSNGAVYEVFKQTQADSVLLRASLSGANEIPPADPDGTGRSNVFINPENNTVCFSIVVADIVLPAAAAHIHAGAADVNGPIVVPFLPPDETGVSTGCTPDVDPALVQDIIANPMNYYVNVHNSEFPGGVVRGQLSPPNQ